MKTRIRALIFALFLAAGAADQALAWNDRGHMTVAYIAYKQLNPATRDRVNDLLKLNPFHDRWAAAVPAGVSAADKDMIIFMLAATWADEIKGEPGFITDGTDNGNRPAGSPDPNRNTGFDDKLKHKYRHFIDTAFSEPGGLTLPPVPTPNAQDSIALFRGVLASADPDPKKSYDLSWLLHLVGDIHQPLHGATRVTSALPLGDNGGNLVKLTCTGCQTELHAYWDDLMGVTKKLTSPPAEKGLPDPPSIRAILRAARLLPHADPAAAAKSSETDWAKESFDDAKQTVYPGLIANADGSFSLNPAYRKNAKKLAKQRVALAGARLANLLNNELK